MRAAYQSAIYRRALNQIIAAPSPDGHGWTIANGDLQFKWMADDPAPQSILQQVHCKCKKMNALPSYAPVSAKDCPAQISAVVITAKIVFNLHLISDGDENDDDDDDDDDDRGYMHSYHALCELSAFSWLDCGV